MQKDMKIIDKNGEKITKTISCRYNLLIVQSLSQAHYQVLVIIILKEFVKLNFNINAVMNNVKLAQLNTNIATAFFNTQTLKMIQWNANLYFVT